MLILFIWSSYCFLGILGLSTSSFSLVASFRLTVRDFLMIHVIATLKVDPARRDEFLESFAQLAPLVRAEEGCLEYGAAVDEPTGMSIQEMAGDDAVVVVEKWESLAALEAHLAVPHMNAWREEVGPMLRGVTLQALRPV